MSAAAHRDDAPAFGPAMAALANDRQRSFVTEYVLTGNASRAARLAGYGTDKTTNDVYGRLAWQLKQRPTVAVAIEEEARRCLRTLAAPSLARLTQIIGDPKSKDADALRAIDMVLGRVDPLISGQVVQVNHNHSHQIRLSADQITKRILELASRVGVEVAALPAPAPLGAAVTIDAVAETTPHGEVPVTEQPA